MIAEMKNLSKKYGSGVSLNILKEFAMPNAAAIQMDKNTGREARDVFSSMVRDGLMTVKTYPLPEVYDKEFMFPTNAFWALLGFMEGRGLLRSSLT